jgi:hypothetical protein
VDKIINRHIDKLDEIERQLDRIIEQEVSQVDIELAITAPQEALAKVVENVKRVFLDEYADKALEMGFDLGRIIQQKIEQDKTIKVDDSENPKLNAESASNKQD